jgi:hypothetical protein
MTRRCPGRIGGGVTLLHPAMDTHAADIWQSLCHAPLIAGGQWLTAIRRPTGLCHHR